MFLTIAISIAALAPSALATFDPQLQLSIPFNISSPTHGPSASGRATCLRGTIHVLASANNTLFLLPSPTSPAELTQLNIDISTINSSFIARTDGGPNPVTGTFGIYVEVCVPADLEAAGRVDTVQFLTHGSTLDHSYWDFAPGYSYVDAAAEAGYATFSYDRLGTGRSEHPDPNLVVQMPLQVEIAHVIVRGLRGLELGGRAVANVVGVGHSLGSALTLGVVNRYPDDFDGLVITGVGSSPGGVVTTQASWDIIPAASDPSGRFEGLDTGYITQGPLPQALQFSLYRYPDYDEEIFTRQFNTRQTTTLAEALGILPLLVPQPSYTGPVDVVLGQQDYPYCQGDCLYPTDQAQLLVDTFFPAASSTGTYLQPNTGHTIAQHYTAGDGFAHMLEFLENNGL